MAGLTHLVVAPSAHAQSSGTYWVALDTSPPGTPARLGVDASQSTLSTTVVQLGISGFWVTPRVGPDGVTYHDIVVPGLPPLMQLGAPRLPVARIDLGVVTGSTVCTFMGEHAQSILHVAGFNPWPSPKTGEFHDGSPGAFVRDSVIYASAGYWPPSVTDSVTTVGMFAGYLADASVSIAPLRWDPSTGDLEVHASSSYTFSHPGSAQLQEETTRQRGNIMSSHFANWEIVSPSVPINNTKYLGEFLFVCPSRYSDALAPLEQQKMTRGFGVTELHTEDIGNNCDQVLAAIRDWYIGSPKGYDHFCILAGGANDIWLCPSPPIFSYQFGVNTDDLYGSPVAQTLDKSVLVGRLSPTDAVELASEVARILLYEDNPPANGQFEDVILAAHRGTADSSMSEKNIKEFQENARLASYSAPPNFITEYGADGAENIQLQSAIDRGCGIMCYIGHGTATEWTQWSSALEDWTAITVDELSNGPRTPVVWSLACRTGSVQAGNSLCEIFMRQGANGAVAAYGATQNAEVDATAALDLYLFHEVYTRNNVVQGYTYFAAEDFMEKNFHEGDAWKYLLLGDPQMTIRRTSPPGVNVDRPAIVSCGAGCLAIDLFATLPGGAPLAGAKAAVWKPLNGAAGASELLDNRYTAASGHAYIPAPSLSDGTLYYSVETDDGFAMRDSVRISGGMVSVPVGGPLQSLRLTASPNLTHGPTHFSFGRPLGGPGRVRLFDVSGREVRSLEAERGASAVEWDGRDGAGSRVASGVYLAVVDDRGARSSTRLVVTR